GFVSQAQAQLLATQDAHKNFSETNETHEKAERHDGRDVPLHDAVGAEIFCADAGFGQGVNPLHTGFAQQAGVAQADQAGNGADDTLITGIEQFDQSVDADVAGGAYAIGDAKEDQPGEQGLSQRVTPGHRLGHAENGI